MTLNKKRTTTKSPNSTTKKPKHDDQKPKLDHKKPKLDHKKPKHDDKKPKLDDKKPKHDDKKPKLDDKKPKLDDKKPKHDDKKPKHDDKKPKLDHKKPKHDDKKKDQDKKRPPLEILPVDRPVDALTRDEFKGNYPDLGKCTQETCYRLARFVNGQKSFIYTCCAGGLSKGNCKKKGEAAADYPYLWSTGFQSCSQNPRDYFNNGFPRAGAAVAHAQDSQAPNLRRAETTVAVSGNKIDPKVNSSCSIHKTFTTITGFTSLLLISLMF